MKINGHMGQLVGPFKARQELYHLIEEDAYVNIMYVEQIGIQTRVGTLIYVNHEPVEIGKTGIYEIGNTEITSLYFDQDTDNHTIVDYVVHKDEIV